MACLSWLRTLERKNIIVVAQAHIATLDNFHCIAYCIVIANANYYKLKATTCHKPEQHLVSKQNGVIKL